MTEIKASVQQDKPDTVQLVYILYLVTLILPGIAAVIGLVLAYMNKDNAPDWLQSHYVYIIHTFWKGLLFVFVGMLTSVVLIGFLILPLALIWWIVRCIKGLQLLGRDSPIPDPRTWLV